jgi:hypothetical protein
VSHFKILGSPSCAVVLSQMSEGAFLPPVYTHPSNVSEEMRLL